MTEKHLLIVCIIGTSLLLFLVIALVMFFAIYRRKLNNHYIEKQQLLIANSEEGERMLNQISREVHDNVGQLSNLLGMMIKRIETTKQDAEKAELLNTAKNLIKQIIEYSHNIKISLDSDSIRERGISNVIMEEVEYIRSSKQAICYINFIGEVRRMDFAKELVIYRIAQEAIHNLLKYSQTKVIDIILHFDSECFLMSIKDYGIGFNVEQALTKGRMGLSNMLERAKWLNANLTIESTPGAGCLVKLSIPKPYHEHAYNKVLMEMKA